MSKQKTISSTCWYTREVCAKCGKLFSNYHTHDVCPECGNKGQHSWSYVKTNKIIIRRVRIQRGYCPWRRYDAYEGKNKFTKKWLKKNDKVVIRLL